MTTTRPRVYLAGPDVFRPDAAQHMKALAHACEALGMRALIPSDEARPRPASKGQRWPVRSTT